MRRTSEESVTMPRSLKPSANTFQEVLLYLVEPPTRTGRLREGKDAPRKGVSRCLACGLEETVTNYIAGRVNEGRLTVFLTVRLRVFDPPARRLPCGSRQFSSKRDNVEEGRYLLNCRYPGGH